MKIQKQIMGAIIVAATLAMASAANAQAVRLNLGSTALGGLGGVSATALGGGSLANVNVGPATATVSGLTNGLNANVNVGLNTPTITPTGPTPVPTTTLGGDTFFSGNTMHVTGGGGGGSVFGNGLQFGDNASANASANVNTQDARRRLTMVAERSRKLVKRRITRINDRI